MRANNSYLVRDAVWAINKQFLDEAIQRGDELILATDSQLARAGSYFAKELAYLESLGYTPGPSGTILQKAAH